MDLKLDQLIGSLQTGIDNVIRSHFAGLGLPAPDTATVDLDATVRAAEADLETILERLRSATQPPAVDATEVDAGLSTSADTHPEVAGQPAPQ